MIDERSADLFNEVFGRLQKIAADVCRMSAIFLDFFQQKANNFFNARIVVKFRDKKRQDVRIRSK